ncbi:MAG: Xaa-Pro peptidase family protein [Acidimicrobiales bacterium]
MTTGDLPALDVSGRLDRVLADLGDAGCEVLVVSGRSNVRWLSGFTGSAGVAVVSASDAVLVTDARYGARADEELAASSSPFSVVVADGPHSELQRLLGSGDRLGLEAAHVSWEDRRTYGEWFPDVDIVAVSGLVERHRMIKDTAELARMRRAARIADAALGEMLPALVDGPTERELATALADAMVRHGAHGVAFPTIVATGPNAARPHHTAGDRVIGSGELVIIDSGAMVDGYRSDMTRTVCVGEPRPGDAELVALVTAAQQAGVDAVTAGVPTRDVDGACRDLIAAAGRADAFVHGAGHGVGLDIHEAPRVSRRADEVLAVGMVVTVEPGVYLDGLTGVRVEDTVVVTDSGAERLTLAPKTLVV